MRLKAVTVSEPKVSGRTPFRPDDEALYPYRAGNRCALNSLDTDRSTTLSPETVTANCVSAAETRNISAPGKLSREKFRSAPAGAIALRQHEVPVANRNAIAWVVIHADGVLPSIELVANVVADFLLVGVINGFAALLG